MRARSRREFVWWMAGTALLAWVPREGRARSRAGDVLSLWLVRPPAGGAEADGARLGAAEGHRALTRVNRRLELLELSPGEWVSAADSEAAPALVVVALADERECRAVATRAAWRDVPVLNVGSASDALRRPGCHPNLLHVVPSDSMRRSALLAHGTPRSASHRVEAWHAGLARHGAAQLNARFASRWGRGMTSPAWAGWMGVTIAVEAYRRGVSDTPAQMLDYLRRPGVAFDGCKGTALTFDAATRQLRQPLYVVPRGAGASGAVPAVGEEIAEVVPPLEERPVVADRPRRQRDGRGCA